MGRPLARAQTLAFPVAVFVALSFGPANAQSALRDEAERRIVIRRQLYFDPASCQQRPVPQMEVLNGPQKGKVTAQQLRWQARRPGKGSKNKHNCAHFEYGGLQILLYLPAGERSDVDFLYKLTFADGETRCEQVSLTIHSSILMPVPCPQ